MIKWITWVAVLAPLPYSLSRLLWALGLPVGMNEKGLDAVGVPGWYGSTYVLGLAIASETVGLLTHRFLLRRHETLPRFLGGRRVARWAVLVPAALISAVLLSVAFAAENALLQFTDPEEFRRQVAPEGWAPAWSFWTQQAIWWVWALSLSLATVAYWKSHSSISWRESAPPPARR